MDTDLLTVARTLAERGWLPGIRADDLDAGNGVATIFDAHANVYVLAEPFLHLAAHNEIVRRGWSYEIRSDGWTSVQIPVNDEEIPWENYKAYSEPGTTTLALLRCLLAACEASEKSKETS